MRTPALAASIVLLACSAAAAADAPQRSVSTTGDAVVHVVPDEVIVGLGVETFAAKLDEAKKLNDDRATRLVRTIKAAGVEERHIQTDTLEVEIKYRSDRPSDGIEGYYARRAYSVTLKQPKKLEELLDAALTNGANQLMGIDYRTTELRKHRDAARQMAIKAAKEKAVALAGELDCTVGPPRTIGEGYIGYGGGRYNLAQNVSRDTGGSPEGADPTPFGQIGVYAQVSVTFDLLPK
jgi:uncharacterized protein YggE